MPCTYYNADEIRQMQDRESMELAASVGTLAAKLNLTTKLLCEIMESCGETVLENIDQDKTRPRLERWWKKHQKQDTKKKKKKKK